MLNITKTVEYGLIAMRHLNENGNRLCTAKEIADIYHIPKEIMAKTMQKLCKEQYIEAVQGSHGGYFLKKELNTINLIDFIEKIEGPIGIVKCIIDKNCDLLEFCNIKSPINKINNNIRHVLNKINLFEITK